MTIYFEQFWFKIKIFDGNVNFRGKLREKCFLKVSPLKIDIPIKNRNFWVKIGKNLIFSQKPPERAVERAERAVERARQRAERALTLHVGIARDGLDSALSALARRRASRAR